jgi:hypothetical protein
MITKAARKRRMALEDRETLMLVALLRVLYCLRLYSLLILTLAAMDRAKYLRARAELRRFAGFTRRTQHLKRLDAFREVW